MEAIVPVEMELPMLRIEAFKEERNVEGIHNSLGLLEERREETRL